MLADSWRTPLTFQQHCASFQIRVSHEKWGVGPTFAISEFLSNQLEILSQHSQSSQEGCYDFSNMFNMFIQHVLPDFIHDFMDHYSPTLEWQKAISAYLKSEQILQYAALQMQKAVSAYL